MRKNFGPQSWLFPMPVLIIGTYDENGNPNVMNAAWGGTTPLICASMLVNYACLLRDELPPYAVSAIDEQLRFLAAEDTASCQVMIDYYRKLGHDFTFEL